ncbi:MAG: Zn-dependent hydrolase [Thermostichales cyanobacterium DRC_bins_46]
MSTTLSLAVNGSRLLETIDQLAHIGRLPNGGVRRLSFSPEDQQARRQVSAWMQATGMTVRTDPAGNLIGRYPGSQPHLPALATGSHIDTVPSGGRYDGCYGVLAGIEIVRTLAEQQLQLRHPLEVIVFSDEENSLIGSQAMSGTLNPDPNYYRRPDGTSIQTCLQRVGGNWDQIHQARRHPQELAAFVELHIEQGPVLESAQASIGIVTGIVGQRRYRIVIEGRANHAGTTPMNLRQDALVTAAHVILRVHDLGSRPGDQVATVGSVQVFPNAANVVPGRVELSLDARDLDSHHLDALLQELAQHLDHLAQQRRTPIDRELTLHTQPAPAHPQIQTVIASVCQDLSLPAIFLPSRASHDAQELARITPMGMIFVPSHAGISHDETEYTTPLDCIRGANVLLHTLLRLDQNPPPPLT